VLLRGPAGVRWLGHGSGCKAVEISVKGEPSRRAIRAADFRSEADCPFDQPGEIQTIDRSVREIRGSFEGAI